MGWSQTHMWWIKIRRDISNVEVPSEEWGVLAAHWAPQPRVPLPGIEVPITLAIKTSGDCGWGKQRVSGIPGVPLKRPTHGFNGTYLLWAPVLASGLWLEGQLSPRQKYWQRPLSLFLSSTPHSWQADAISESPSTWLSLFIQPWWFPNTLPHPTCWPTQPVSSGFYIGTACLAHA